MLGQHESGVLKGVYGREVRPKGSQALPLCLPYIL